MNFIIINQFLYFQYSSVDTSPLSVYIMHPFWNKVVHVCFLLKLIFIINFLKLTTLI